MKTLYVADRAKFSTSDNIAFVLCGYHGDDRAQTRSLSRRAGARLGLNANYENDVRVMNYYANPRSLPYLLELIREFREINQLRRPAHLFIDETLGRPDTDVPARSDAKSFSFSRLSELRDELTGCSVVVLVSADAIGLGCEAVEQIARESGRLVVALNGRRRAFLLDARTQRALWWRRTLSRWRVDWMLAVAFVPLAAIFAIKDAVTQRKTV